MMKRAILSFVALASLLSCTRATDTLGPNLADIYGPFTIFEDFDASTDKVDFGAGQSVVFSARFNKNVDWEIHVIGQTSGAEKIFSGKSNVINQDNGRWNGSTTNLPMFKNEQCLAFLTVLDEGYSDTLGSFITIESVKIDDGFVVADFETGLNPGWIIFKQSGADMSFQIRQSDSAAQAQNFYHMGGAVNFDYLIGYIYFPATAYNEVYFPLPENPDNSYFNVQLSKEEGINNEIILFRFLEDDNGDGVFNTSNEDMYSLELKNINKDWTTISIRYADLQALVNGAPSTPAGNGLREPSKLLKVEVLFLADPSSGYSQTSMDYIIFTENKALEP